MDCPQYKECRACLRLCLRDAVRHQRGRSCRDPHQLRAARRLPGCCRTTPAVRERCDAIPSEPACGAVVPQVLPRMGRIQLRYDNRAGEALEKSYKTISN